MAHTTQFVQPDVATSCAGQAASAAAVLPAVQAVAHGVADRVVPPADAVRG